MTHPLYNLHHINLLIDSIHADLLDVNDRKAQVLSTIKEIKESIINARNSFNQLEQDKKWEQIGYFDEVKIEFSICNLDDEIIDLHERKFADYSLNMKMIKDIINAERALQNQNENLMTARITLLDVDVNLHDGEV